MNNAIFKRGALYLYLIIISYACKTTDTESYQTVDCTLESSIDTLPDSTFMSGAIGLQAIDNDIYFIERSSKQLIKLDKGFNDNHLYMASFNRKSKECYTRINIDTYENDWVAESFGESFEFENSLQNIIRNKRDLLRSGDFFYSISDNQPIIEKYNINPEFELNAIYQLPGDIYSTFCVDEKYFYAFNSNTASIDKIKK